MRRPKAAGTALGRHPQRMINPLQTKGEMPHKHIGYNHGKDGKMSVADKLLVEKVKKIWKEYNENA